MSQPAPSPTWLRRRETRLIAISGLLFWLAQRPWPGLPPGLEASLAAGLIVVAPAPFLAALARSGGAGAAVWLAVVWWGPGSWWVRHCDPVFGLGAWAGVVVFAMAFTWPLGLVLGRFRQRFGAAVMLWLAPAVWCAWEMARLWGPFGCPWFALAHSFWRLPVLLQFGEVAGLAGLNLATATVAAGLARKLAGVPGARAQTALGLALFAGLAAYGAVRQSQLETGGRPVRVALVQPAVGQRDKALSDPLALTRRHLALSASAPAGTELIVWPETAIPDRVLAYPDTRREILAAADRQQATLIIGGIDPDPTDSLTSRIRRNAAFVVAPQAGVVEVYHKVHLVILGEYLPWRDREPIKRLAAHTPQYWPGSRLRAVETPVGRLGLPICYEIGFPADTRAIVADGAEALVVLTNDDQLTEIGARQFYQQTVFRAIEQRRWIARCANGGISAIIDPTGRPVAESRWAEATVLTGTLHLADEVTLYQRRGEWLPLGCLLATLLALAWRPKGGVR